MKLLHGRGGHYSMAKIESMEDVRVEFPERVDFTLNLFFCGTSGVHGSYRAIDDIEDSLALPEGHEDRSDLLTVLIVNPRLVRIAYGDIAVTAADLPYLRRLVDQTIAGIVETQEGSLPAGVEWTRGE